MFDTHCHVQFNGFKEDALEIVKKCGEKKYDPKLGWYTKRYQPSRGRDGRKISVLRMLVLVCIQCIYFLRI
jgi:hypothetical protein